MIPTVGSTNAARPGRHRLLASFAGFAGAVITVATMSLAAHADPAAWLDSGLFDSGAPDTGLAVDAEADADTDADADADADADLDTDTDADTDWPDTGHG